MKKEERYLVLKLSDLKDSKGVMADKVKEAIETLETEAAAYRLVREKKPLKCVVVVDDLREHDDVRKAIEKRVDSEDTNIFKVNINELINLQHVPINKPGLSKCDINVFGLDILAESYLRLKPDPNNPLHIFFPVNRKDCIEYSGLNIRLEAVRKTDTAEQFKE